MTYRVGSPLEQVMSFSYDSNNLVSSITLPNGKVITEVRNADGGS